jgi:hypothetical protein
MKKLFFTTTLILSVLITTAQIDFKNDGISIDHIEKLLFKVNSGNYGYSVVKLDAVINNDVFNFFEKEDFGKNVDTELQQKIFMQTDKYLKLKDSLRTIKQDIEKFLLIGSGYANLSDYNIRQKSFSLKIDDLMNFGEKNNKPFWIYNNFSFNILPLEIESHSSFSGYKGKIKLKVKDEMLALKIEENRRKINFCFISNVSEKISNTVNNQPIFIPDFIRILLFNKENNEIYLDKVFLENEIYDLLEKDKAIEGSNVSSFKYKYFSNKQKLEQKRINQINNLRANDVFGNSTDKKSQEKEFSMNNYKDENSKVGLENNLTGRYAIKLQKPSYPGDEEGIIVVQIHVNRKGNVIKAIPGVRGSTSLSSALLNAAKNAALLTKFNESLEAPDVQTGTITYQFVCD